MRQRSETWRRLAARGRFRMESIAVIGGVEYTAISAPVINRALLANDLSVGNCISATLKMSVLTDDEIGKSASVVIKARITDDVEYSEWLEFGTFYIDNRTVNSGLVTLLCYDSMLKASQQYVDETKTDDRIGWPKTMQACVTEIAARIGVEIDPRTVIKTGDAYQVPYPTKLTMMQVLGYIGACHGGNWIITPENKLRLVPLLSPPTESFNIIDHDYNPIYTGDGHKLVWKLSETGETVEQKAGGGLINVPVVIGKIETSKTRTVSRVTLARDTELGYTLGDDTGFEIRIESNPYACQAICDDLFAELNGLEYAPYNIQAACYDPATELGDWVLVGDQVRSVLYTENATLNVDFRSNISAPGKDEVSSEYPFLTTIERLKQKDEQLEKYLEESKTIINSKIEQTHTSILLEVSGTYATQEQVSADLNILAEEIVAEVERATTADEQMSGRITVNANSISSEVTRAKAAEQSLSSSITQTAEKIDLKVSKGDVSSQISVESGKVTIGANRLTINSDNFTLSGTGTVTAKGSLSSEIDNLKTEVTGGSLKFYVDDSLAATILGGADHGNDGTDRSLQIYPYLQGIMVREPGKTPDVVIDYGLSDTYSMGGTKIQFWDTVVFGQGFRCNWSMIFQECQLVPVGDSLDVEGNFEVEGDFTCTGTKNRIVSTDNYGRLALNAMESTSAIFADIGTAMVDASGKVYVYLDPRFIEVTDRKHEYQVFLTCINKASNCYVEKEEEYFVIYGEPNTVVDWIVYIRQRDYAQTYIESANAKEIPNEPADSSIFVTDDKGATISSAYMDEFSDTYDTQAEVYLQNYELEVTNYGN